MITCCSAIGAGERIEAKDKIDEDTSEVFRCLCGECSLESYLEYGCHKSNSCAFPYLDISKMDVDDKEDLTYQLSHDTSDMITSFAKLLDEVCVSLKKQGISVQNLAKHALSIDAYDSDAIQKPLLSEDEKQLTRSKTIDEAILVLRPHMSFFNFELLKHITDSRELCSDSDRERMDEYISKFDTFYKRKVFEVPHGAVDRPVAELKKYKKKIFAVLMTKHEAEPNLIFGDAAKRKIAKLLNLKPSILYIYRIDDDGGYFVAEKSSIVVKLENERLPGLMSSATEEHHKGKKKYNV